MAHISFNEYVKKQQKGDKGQKAKTAVVADYEGPSKASPETGMMPDNGGGIGQKGKMTPYAGKEKPVDPNKGKLMDGLAKKPESTDKGSHGKPVKVLGNYPTMKTSEWLKRTGKMSLAEFAKVMRNERTAGLESPSKTYEAIRETFSSCKQNSSWINDAIAEMKRCGLFESFFAAMSAHSEAAGVLAKLMESESFARKLVVAIDEMVAPPVGGKDDIGGEGDSEEMHGHGHRHKEDEEDDEEDGQDEDGEDADDADDADGEDEGDDEEMAGAMDGQEMDARGDEDMDGGQGSGESMPQGGAKQNLMKAMKSAGFM